MVRPVRFLPLRLRQMAPEAVAFAAIGVGNLVLYFLIFNALIIIGAVKATVIATLVTTYLAYLANRHWTYKDRPRGAVRREYTLFFAVNLVGLFIQSAGTGMLKYGFGMSERQDRLAFNITTTVCICAATLFRFWTYRTFVFKDTPAGTGVTGALATPVDGPAADGTTPVVDLEPPVVAPAEGLPVPVPDHR
ncbi:GtrA family protein [Planosporangium sp. 12N6]|uniref:GtrA family protein n=1 Tax=Planosporangium spinosum TaxID=3402278 RepID=UPI003CF0EE6C